MCKKKVPQKQNGGRPAKKIDWNLVDQALIAGATGARVAAYLGIHRETLYDAVQREFGVSFTDYSHEKHQKGDSMIQMKQFQEAMKGDRGMLIWLGKQRLGQRDNQDMNVNGNGLVVKVVSYKDIDKDQAEN